MKVLIWFFCIMTNAVITVLLGYMGVFLGGIPTALLFVLTVYAANWLCKKWDAHCIYRDAQQRGVMSIDIVRERVPLALLYECEDRRQDVTALKALLKKARKHYGINAAQADILLDEYRRFNATPLAPRPSPAAPTAPQTATAPVVRFCRRCGAPRIKNARFCNKCGTAYIEQ